MGDGGQAGFGHQVNFSAIADQKRNSFQAWSGHPGGVTQYEWKNKDGGGVSSHTIHYSGPYTQTLQIGKKKKKVS